MGIENFLLEHAKKNPVSFHMPGHKGADLYRRLGYGSFLETFMDCDITEIHGADNLFQTEGIIRKVQEQYASLYGAEQSYLLINGTSGGILAAVLACVEPGGKLIMARNCHKSVFNALVLGDIQPIYAYPQVASQYGLSGPITAQEVEKCILSAPDAAAVILPSPNYYGICSDIQAISQVVHDHGKILIVDQAHGAHLKFFSPEFLPKCAEERGADIVINSTHKTLASLTQSAVLNRMSERVDKYALEDKLQAVQSTSPSYILMASLDINGQILAEFGGQLFGQWKNNLEHFYGEICKLNRITTINDIDGLDSTKINLNTEKLGMSGESLEKKLREFGIFAELSTGNILMCMTGIGNKREDYERLLVALREIELKAEDGTFAEEEMPALPGQARLFEIPKKKMRVLLEEAAGKICASSIIPYPPGIPLICPGEEITAEAVACVSKLRSAGKKVIGVNDSGEVVVGAERQL